MASETPLHRGDLYTWQESLGLLARLVVAETPRTRVRPS